MKMPRYSSWSAPVRVLAAAAAVVTAGLPLIAQSQDSTSAQEIYRQDRAACMNGDTNQSRADCLYEARSALRDRLNGDPQLNDSNDARVARAADGGGSTMANSGNAAGSQSDSSTYASNSYGSSSGDSSNNGANNGELAPRADRN